MNREELERQIDVWCGHVRAAARAAASGGWTSTSGPAPPRRGTDVPSTMKVGDVAVPRAIVVRLVENAALPHTIGAREANAVDATATATRYAAAETAPAVYGVYVLHAVVAARVSVDILAPED